jgi:hypothetical protein
MMTSRKPVQRCNGLVSGKVNCEGERTERDVETGSDVDDEGGDEQSVAHADQHLQDEQSERIDESSVQRDLEQIDGEEQSDEDAAQQQSDATEHVRNEHLSGS